MTQPIADYSFGLMDNLDVTLSSSGPIQPSSPTEETNLSVRHDQSTSNSYYELDLAEVNMTLYCEQEFRDMMMGDFIFDELISNSPVLADISELLNEDPEEVHSRESNDMAGSIQSTDEHLVMIKTGDSTALPVIRPHVEKLPTRNAHAQPIALSASVAVSVPTPHQLQIVHPLEDTYRARYKSDYFPQKGSPRRPRYVADSVGNHFVTLQLPAENDRVVKDEYICISLLTTPNNNRGYFYSPYKFQIDHNDRKVSDQNPIYLPVQKYLERDSTLKLHLVLIKSKLDELNHAQPLKPFVGTIGSVQNIITEAKLSPKDLINEYQLDKSHIAFTLCTKVSADVYEAHPETTVVSSVITEVSPAGSKAKPKPTTTNTAKKICCPNCAHSFDLPDGEKGEKRKSASSTAETSSKGTTNTRTNKKKKAA
jgi:hypothetical protein